MTINFGSINRRRCVTFKVTEDGKVLPKKFMHIPVEEAPDSIFITARESFLRWKIARKAWRIRRYRNQLQFEFEPITKP